MKALIITDIQNDFLPGGALAVRDGDKIIPTVNQLSELFPLVVATQDWHPANHGSFAANHPGRVVSDVVDLNGLPQILWPVHCVQGSAGAELSPKLKKDRIAKIFHKGVDADMDSYSTFFDNDHRKSTGLGEWLKTQGVTEVYLCGLATDYCVKWSALDAVQLGLKTFVIDDACRGVKLHRDDVKNAIEEMRRVGVQIVSSAQIPGFCSKATLCQGQFLSLVREGHWEYANRTNATGAAIILAVTDEKKLLLVEQYRIPCHARTIELPAGIIGDEPGAGDESHAEAARRELEEETGYSAQQIEALTTGPASSGLTSEIVTLFRATGLKRVGDGGGVANESILVHEVPLEQVDSWLCERAKTGILIDPKIYACLYFLRGR